MCIIDVPIDTLHTHLRDCFLIFGIIFTDVICWSVIWLFVTIFSMHFLMLFMHKQWILLDKVGLVDKVDMYMYLVETLQIIVTNESFTKMYQTRKYVIVIHF